MTLVASSSVHADDAAEAQRSALKEIRETAAFMCNTIDPNVDAQSVELSADAKAKLGGLIGKIADMGIDGATKYKSEKFNGPLREQLAKAIKDNADCRLHVFDILQEKMLGGRSEIPLNRAHFEFLDKGVFGGLVLSIANPTSEEMSVYDVDWAYPAKMFKSLGGADLSKINATTIDSPMEFPRGPRIGILPGQIAEVPVLAYSCTPDGKSAWQYLNSILTSPRTGVVGECSICLKVATVSQPEIKLCKNTYCDRLAVITKLPC